MNIEIDLSKQNTLFPPQFISSITFLLTANSLFSQISTLSTYFPLYQSRPLIQTHIRFISLQPSQLKSYPSVAVGGTFDHLHLGHYILLSYAALSAQKYLYIGITGAQMLKHKNCKQLLQPYQVRQSKVVNFIRSIKPQLILIPHQLHDPYGMTITVKDIDCIVVSEETIAGGNAVNKVRQESQFPALQIVVCPALGLKEANSTTNNISSKISSSHIRQHILQKNRMNVIQYMEYKSIWMDTMKDLNSLPNQKWFHAIVERYSQYWRHYHTNQHIYNLLVKNNSLEAIIRLAIFFHDIIYIPSSTTNEEDSIELCKEFLQQCSLMQHYQQIALLIIQTKTHVPTNALSQKLFDLDMGILDAEPQKYQQYSRDIQMEYSYLGEKYPSLRKTFLMSQINKQPLFSYEPTHYYNNIKWELSQ